MKQIILHTTAAGTVDAVRHGLRISLASGPVGVSTTAGRSVASLRALLGKVRGNIIGNARKNM